MRKIIPLLMLATLLTACGVKSDLIRPNGTPTAKTETDPSKPPVPLGR